MIRRSIEPTLLRAAETHPVVTLTGPRQSGKTTLCRALFSHLAYVSLERPTTRAFALEDPVGFLAQYQTGAVLDEIQRAPELPAFLQGMVDDDPQPGRFVLTGSQHLGTHQAVAQSLAGRTAILELLPLSLEEISHFDSSPAARDDLFSVLLTGAYPAIHDRKLQPAEWLSSYVATYVERDVRQLLNVGDLITFQSFVQLAAGRTAQLLNLSSLAGDCGITHNTAKAWLSVLEASFLTRRLLPYAANIKKRLVKSPKLHFLDTGLICYLLDIQSADQLRRHPARGAIFESWVVSELLKERKNRGLRANLSFFRDRAGLEVDVLSSHGRKLRLLEAKSGQTAAGDAFSPLQRVAEIIRKTDDFDQLEAILIYGGEEEQRRSSGRILPWMKLGTLDWG